MPQSRLAWLLRFKSVPFFAFFAVVAFLYVSILLDESLWFRSLPVTNSLRSSTRNPPSHSSSGSSFFASAAPVAYKKPLVMPGRPIIPSIIYGTAWKKERTAELVELAIRSGFRAIDTACQPKHYFEKGVGDALERLYAAQIVRREDLFLQTKFTSVTGQDPASIPYDRHAPLREQVLQSFSKSCENLRTTYLDSLVMHSPMRTMEETLVVWRTFEAIYRDGGVKYLGISNVYSLPVLQQLYEKAEVKPSFVQNRFYRETGYDKEIRAYCSAHNMVYQSFWTLTANPHLLKSPVLTQIAHKYHKTPPQVLYKFVQALGIVPLDGTTSEEHMREDLDLHSFALDAAEVDQLRALL